MDRLRKLYHSLSKAEIRYLKSYLEAFHSKGENKALRLIELLDCNKDISQDEASRILYGNPKSKAMLMLRSRLMERILDVLTLSINLQGNPIYKEDPPLLETVQIFKMYSQARLLRRRGLGFLAEELLEKIAKQSETQGIPEGKILALLQLRNISTSPQDVGWKLKLGIEEAIDQYKQDILAAGFFDEFRVIHSGRTSSDPEKVQFLQDATSQLEKELESTYSVRAHYYYLDMMVSLHSLRMETDKCRIVLQEQIDLVASQPGLKTSTRQGIPMMRLARLELMHGNFEAAYIASEHACQTFNPKRNNYLSASAYFLFSSIFTNRIKDVFESLKSLPPLMARKKQFPSTSIIQYLFSCGWFIKSDFKQAGIALDEAENLLSDKGGWNVGIRVYEIMILIEKDLLDIASNRIETLRKHIGRYKVTERENLIYRYLYLLDKAAFDFSEPSKEMQDILSKLRDGVMWEPVSHEVIRFDSWVVSKITHSTFYEQLLSDIQKEKVGV